MSLLGAKLASVHYRLRYRILQVTALFAMVESSLLAKSLGVDTINQSRLAAIRNTSTRLSSDNAMISEKTPEHNAATETKTPASKLEALRARMKDYSLDCYIIPADDPHLSEYVPAAYMRRKFISGFSGSAGTALVTSHDAMLWTDSRYWNQANMQLDSSLWSLMKERQPNVPTIIEYLGEKARMQQDAVGETERKKLRVGIDPFVFPSTFADEFEERMQNIAKEANGDDKEIGELVLTSDNLIDPIWGKDRPPIPYNRFRVHPMEYAGMSVEEKVTHIRAEMKIKKATMAVFCTLDDVAYLLNIRCMGDIDTCPVGIAYATVTEEEICLFCDGRKVLSSDVQEHLSGVKIKPYEDIVEEIRQHVNDKDPNNKVWIDKSRSNLALVSVIPKECLVGSQNAITPLKACKNEQELNGMRKAHEVDGAAMANFISWLEEKVVVQGESVSEVEIDEVLTGYRARQPGFLERSFPTIAGVGRNAAIVHYSAKPGNIMKFLNTSEPILIDSGGQYVYGTTDVTRTLHFGKPTKEFKELYTRVLKGNIAVDTTIFPENTPGFVLDVLARHSLWKAQKDYGHGTGHGVGAALNVHEGPMSISPKFGIQEGLKKGMVVSNEPGYYEDGAFGIRIENLLEIQETEENTPTEKKFLKFIQLTLIPIQQDLIDVKLLTEMELDWLDAYHELVFEKISPLLEAESLAIKWLEKSCKKIDRLSS